MLEGFQDSPALSSAFLQVKENQGCAGVDGVTIAKFQTGLNKNLSILQHELESLSYLPLPLLKILVEKSEGSNEARALCIPAVRDRVVQTAVLNAIEPLLEKEFEECSFAFRKGRSVAQVVDKIKEYYDSGYRWVVDADIDAFFDSVDHAILISKVKRQINNKSIIRLIELWIKAEVWDGESLKILDRGIPQGSPLSPMLSNLFLDELDEAMLRNSQRYVRYADDFIVLCKSPEKAADALELTDKILKTLSLKLDEADIVSFDHGFKYLGVTFLKSMVMVPFGRRKKNKKVLYYPPPLNMTVYNLKKRKGW